MGIVNKVTLKYLVKNKRRTLVTIMGVIISVAMITAVSSISGSFMYMFQRIVIEMTGDWQVLYLGVESSQLDTIEKDTNVKNIIVQQDSGYAVLENSQNSQRPYLHIDQYNTEGMQDLPVTLIEGRYPETAYELAISDQIAQTAGVTYHVGDSITLNLGYRTDITDKTLPHLDQKYPYTKNEQFTVTDTQAFTITGIISTKNLEYSIQPGYMAISALDINTLKDHTPVDISVSLNKIDRGLYAEAEKLAHAIGAGSIRYNSQLLMYYGVTDDNSLYKTFLFTSLIIGIIILIGSISLIYNAFAISLSERSRQLGMLSGIGATKIQKRNSVFYEGFIIGIIAIPLGILSGILGIGITFMVVDPLVQNLFGIQQSLQLKLSPLALCGTTLFSILVIVISAWIPARIASKITSVEAIRQTHDIKIRPKDVKTSFLTKKLFGFEAELGLKNIKRNRSRYIAILFSMVISIVLYISAAAFSLYIEKSYGMAASDIHYDLVLNVYGQNAQDKYDADICQQYLRDASQLEGVKGYLLTQSLNVVSNLTENQITEDVKRRNIPYEGAYPLSMDIYALDDNTLRAYANETGTDFNKLNKGTVQGILVNKYQLKEGHKFTEISMLKVTQGDVLPYAITGEDNNSYTGNIKIVGMTDLFPKYMEHYQNIESMSSFILFVSENAMASLFDSLGENEVYPSHYFHGYFTTDDAATLEKNIEELKVQYPGISSYTYNLISQRNKDRQISILLKVFLYGFILLITAVSVANIFNTISTGVALRKREFAMLKSVGITPEGFRKMIYFESLFYGLKALIYGLPVGIGSAFLIFKMLQGNFDFSFSLPWISLVIVIIAVFLIIGVTLVYSVQKVKKENIIDALKNENL